MSFIRTLAAAALLTFAVAAPVLASPEQDFSLTGSFVFNVNENGPN